MQRIRIGIVGLGKIALEEHVPALKANDSYELAAAVGGQSNRIPVPVYSSIGAMLHDHPKIEAVAICTPPQTHFDAASTALKSGCHVLLEKPPCASVEEFDSLVTLATRMGKTLFQTWHARETPVVEAASSWLSHRKILRGRVTWKEDVRHWHPHQDWIWREGGFGVLDAGINAISILTRILPLPLSVEAAHLLVPANCETPIAAAVGFRTAEGAIIDADFDFRHPVTQDRSIVIETDAGTLELLGHGAELRIDGEVVASAQEACEYASLYRQFRSLISAGQSNTDKRPLELVDEVFRMAGRATVAPFRD